MRLLLLAIFDAASVWRWLHRLGGAGLILLGIADNSLFPLPGSMDVFTIVLAAHKREWWPYYAFMATMGAVLGGYLTYRLAEKGGEETLERKIGKQRAQGVYQRFEKHGSFWVFLGAILPPPFPMTPFLMGAGILHYPKKKFVASLSAGRGLRYFAEAYIGHIYGRAIISFLSQYYRPVLDGLIALAVVGGISALLYFQFYRPQRRREEKRRGEPVEEFPIPGRGNQKLAQEQRSTEQETHRRSA
jgi:membrane protein YqaA with SNARE-associated domain